MDDAQKPPVSKPPTVRARLQAKCPTCGGVREVFPRGDAFVMAIHEWKKSQSFDGRCGGGSPAASDVLAWARAARIDKERSIAALDTRREEARAELAKRLAEIDTIEAHQRAEVEAYDRAIKRIERKAAQS